MKPVDIKKWSYFEASRYKKIEKAKNPEIAKNFLTLIDIRDFTVGHIKKYEKINQQTR